MPLTNYSKLAAAALAAVLLLAAAESAQAGCGRAVWSYQGGKGTFSAADSPGRWVEKTHLNTVYVFKETQRNGRFVEIHDASRGITVRLYDDACYIRHSGTGGRFQLLYQGYWTD